MSGVKIELDTEKLTWSDWETLQDWSEGKPNVRALRGVLERAGGLTDEQISALPHSAVQRAFRALTDALSEETNQKN